ncbi:MAG: hypothetical protein ABW182_01540 [Sphingomonas sp.]
MTIGTTIRFGIIASVLATSALAGCSGSNAAAPANEASTPDPQARTVARDHAKGRTMSASKRCGSTRIERSACMIELILDDIRANYGAIGGGGITSIKAGVGMSYTIALPQEGRTDLFTYEFELRGDEIAIKSKKESTQSY